VFLCDDPRQALQGADIICTATTSSTPVFDDTDLSKGVHINAVGSYTPDAYEIPMETLGRARVFVDSMDAAGVESGEISQGLANGILQTSEILEIGQALIDESLTRNNADEITMFKSVGIAVQDAVAGKIALENARKLGLGREISL
jgi:ornithine cyclodeaminase